MKTVAHVVLDQLEEAGVDTVFGIPGGTAAPLLKALVDRRQNLDEAQQAELQEWNALCKGQKVVRQQQHAAGKARELTSYERKEAEWKSADIAMSKKGGGGDGGGGGLDGWCAKQS